MDKGWQRVRSANKSLVWNRKGRQATQKTWLGPSSPFQEFQQTSNESSRFGAEGVSPRYLEDAHRKSTVILTTKGRRSSTTRRTRLWARRNEAGGFLRGSWMVHRSFQWQAAKGNTSRRLWGEPWYVFKRPQTKPSILGVT